jgi:hypothetical protein
MDWVRNIADVAIHSDTDAKCNWFSYAYVAVMYGLLLVSFLFVLALVQKSRRLGSYVYAWRIAAGIAIGFTLVFYVTCQRSLPRKNVL